MAGTAKWPDIPLYTAPNAPQGAHEHGLREGHVGACATTSFSGTCGQAQDHVQTCISAIISVSGHVGPEDHVHACSTTSHTSGT